MTTLKQLQRRLVRTVLSVQRTDDYVMDMIARMRKAIPRSSLKSSLARLLLPLAHNILVPRQIIQWDC